MRVQGTKTDTEILPGVTMAWLMEDAITPSACVSLARMTVDVATTSEAHKHDNCTEVIHLLSGQIQQRCGDDWLGMKAGETILIPSNAIHQTKNVGEQTAVLMVTYSAGKRNYLASS